MMANEQGVVGSFLQPVEVALEGDVPLEDVAEYFGWELGYVQQGVPSAFELDDGPLVLFYLFLQRPDGVDVDLVVHSVFQPR